MLDTLGQAATCALAIVAIIVVPIGLARIWWPVVKQQLGGIGQYLRDTFITSIPAEPARAAPGTAAIHVSIPRIDTPPDTGEMPRLSRRMSIDDLIVLLAVQRGADNKYLFAANKIAALVGGSHNDVMAKIKELRAERPAPVYRQYTDEERAVLQSNGHE
jgi:hypothetical protein